MINWLTLPNDDQIKFLEKCQILCKQIYAIFQNCATGCVKNEGHINRKLAQVNCYSDRLFDKVFDLDETLTSDMQLNALTLRI